MNKHRLNHRFGLLKLNRRWPLLGGIMLLIILIPLTIYLLRTAGLIKAAWYNDRWLYRQKASVTNTGSTLTNYQVSISLDTASLITAAKMRSDCGDIRITTVNGTIISDPYFVANCNSATTTIWLKVGSLPGGGTTYYVYYGNSAATSIAGTSDQVFDFYDDFTGSTFAPGRYSFGSGTVTQNNYVSLVNDSDSWNTTIYTQSTFDRTAGLIYQATFKADTGTRAMIGIHDNGTGTSYADLIYALFFNNGDLRVYEDGNDRGPVGTYTVGQWYDIKIIVKATGATYYTKITTSPNWTQVYDSAYSTESPIRFAVAHYDNAKYSYTDNWLTKKFAATEPTETTGTEEAGPRPLNAYWKFDEGGSSTYTTPLTKNEQQINLLNQTLNLTWVENTYMPTDNSLGLFKWDATKYTSPTVYLDVDFNVSYAAAYIALYDSGGNYVTNSEVTAGSGRYRSAALTLTSGTSYTPRVKCASGLSGTCQILGARIIVVQNNASKLTNSETQIEVGDNEPTTSTGYTALTNKKLYYYDASRFLPAPTAYFEATFRPNAPVIEQQINILDQAYPTTGTQSTYVPTDNSLGMVNWTSTKYTNPTVYFEANVYITSYTTGYAALYDATTNSYVTDSEVSVGSGSTGGDYNYRLRSAALSLTSGHNYTVRAKCASGLGGTCNLYTARLIVTQTDTTKITDSATQIEVGDSQNSFTNTTAAELTNPKYYQYDATKFSPTVETGGSVDFSATVNIADAGDTVYADLYNQTHNTLVATVSNTGNTNWTYATATAINGDSDWDTSNADKYTVKIRCSDDNGGGCSGSIANAKIILNQTGAGGISALELIRDYSNTLKTTTSGGYSHLNYPSLYTPGTLGVLPTIYLQATAKTSAGTGNAIFVYNDQYDERSSTSEFAVTNTSYDLIRSSPNFVSDLNTTPQNTDVAIKVSGGNTFSLASLQLVIQLSNLPTSGTDGGVVLYNKTDSANVTGSDLTSTGVTYTTVRSNAISLTSGKEYEVRPKKAALVNAKIILDQADTSGINALETIEQYINTLTTTTNGSYVSQAVLNQFDPGNFNTQILNYNQVFGYFETTMKTGTGTGYSDLYTSSGISGSEITTTQTGGYERVRSNDIFAALPTSATNVDTQLYNTASGTISVANSWLIIENNPSLLGTTHDTTPNGNHGNVSGATWKTGSECLIGNCLLYDGINDFVKVPNVSKLNFGADDSFTLTAWFKHISNNSLSTILAKFDSSTGSDGGYKLQMTPDGKLMAGIDDDNLWNPDDAATTSASYDDSKWHQVAMVKNSTSSLKLYIDGLFVASKTTLVAIGTLSNTDGFFIGIDGDGTSSPWKGLIDEIKVYPYARSDADIKVDYTGGNAVLGTTTANPVGNGLVGYWKMDESTTYHAPVSFNYTGADQTYTVPSDVTSIMLKVWGGGGGGGNLGDWSYGFPGGGGGYASSLLSVTPGQILTVMVGGGGTKGSTGSTTASYGGGGRSCGGSDCRYGGQGGGRSAIRSNSTDLITAGGGGGGGSSRTINIGQSGGAGGGLLGADAVSGEVSGAGGRGGTQTAGGAGGTSNNINGLAGSQYAGGYAGGTQSYGAGGGGGWYGGGGGAYQESNTMAGGGGGSGYIGGSGVMRGTLTTGSGITPGNSDDSDRGTAGLGGAENTDGNSGRVLIFTNYSTDTSGNGTDATLNSNASFAAGKFGNAVSFNGSALATVSAALSFPHGNFLSKQEAITVTNNTASTLTNYPVQMMITYDPDMQANFNDLRFYNSQGTGLNSWIQSYVAATSAVVWVKVDSIPGSGTATLYLKFGNSALSGNNLTSTDVMTGYEHFDGDFSSWTYSETNANFSGGTTASLSVSSPNSYVIAFPWTGSTTGQYGQIAKTYTFDGSAQSFEVKYRDDYTGGTSGYHFARLLIDGTVIASEDVAGDEGGWITLSGTNTPSAGDHSVILQLYEQQGVGSFGVNTYWDNLVIRKLASPDTTYSVGTKTVNSSLVSEKIPLTLSAWVNATTLDSSQRLILARGSSPSFDWAIGASATNSGKLWYTLDGLANQGTSNTTLSTGSWYLITLTSDGNKTTLYLNGVPDSQTNNNGVLSGSGYISLGAASNGTQGWSGKIDDVRVYNRTLSLAEIQQLYNSSPGPVGWWKLDEGTGTSANDTSGNNYVGTLASGTQQPTWKPAKFGYGLSFDGNDYMSAGTQSQLNMGAGDFTLSTWFRTSVGTNSSLVGNGSAGTNGYRYNLSINTDNCGSTGRIKGEIDDNTTKQYICSTTAYNDNLWHYASLVRSGTKLRLYVDGVEVNTPTDITGYGSLNSSRSFTIGTLYDETSAAYYQFLTGSLDDVKVYNYARTPTQIFEDMNAGHPAPGSPVGSAVGYWKFDEGYGDTANNSGNGGSALNANLAGPSNTCPGNSLCPTFTNDGKFGKALSFDGSNDYLDIAYTSSLDPSNLTLSAWIKRTGSPDASNGGGIAGKWETNQGYLLWLGTDNNLYFALDASPHLNSGVTLALNTWYHVVGTFDGTTAKIYINGILKNSQSDTLTGRNTPFEIGRYAKTSNTTFPGIIDEVKIYNFALTEDQIKADYNQGKAQVMGALSTDASNTPSNSATNAYCPPGQGTTCTGPVGEWKFDENTGTTANDSSGNGHTATEQFVTDNQWVPGKFGSARKFDGTYNRLSLSQIDLGTTHTCSFWLNYQDSGDAIILAKDTGNYCAYVDGTNIYYSAEFSHFVTVAHGGMNNGSWNYFAVVRSGSTATFYKNGVQLGTPQTMSTSNNLILDSIGAYDDGSYFLQGLLDNVRLYNYARTPAQIAWEYNQGAPIAWYRFDECTGTAVHNAAPAASGGAAGIDGTIYPNTGRTAGTCGSGVSTEMWNGGTTGKYSSSLAFDGAGDYVGLPDNSPVWLPQNDLTVAAWVYLNTSPPGISAIFSGNYGASGVSTNRCGFIFQTNTGGQINEAVTINNGSYSLTGNSTLSLNKWTHVVMVRSGDALSIYYNGVVDGTLTGLTTDPIDYVGAYSNNAVSIGRTSDTLGASSYFPGLIDDVRLYNYALNSTQVKTLYNNASVAFIQ